MLSAQAQKVYQIVITRSAKLWPPFLDTILRVSKIKTYHLGRIYKQQIMAVCMGNIKYTCNVSVNRLDKCSCWGDKLLVSWVLRVNLIPNSWQAPCKTWTGNLFWHYLRNYIVAADINFHTKYNVRLMCVLYWPTSRRSSGILLISVHYLAINTYTWLQFIENRSVVGNCWLILNDTIRIPLCRIRKKKIHWCMKWLLILNHLEIQILWPRYIAISWVLYSFA